MDKSRNKALVIGGSGFIGSHVVDRLVCAGYETSILDIKVSKWAPESVKMIIGDLTDQRLLNAAFEGQDIVLNFGGVSDLNYALDEPIDTAMQNVVGNLVALEACKQNKVRKFVLASTIYVNSREGGYYRCSKQASEEFTNEFCSNNSIDHRVFRYGSVYGPRSGESNGLYRILRRALNEQKIIYEGHPEATRDYVHVFDAARATVELMEAQNTTKNFTIVGHRSLKIDDLLKMISEMMNIPEKNIQFKKSYTGHYVRTPYSFDSRLSSKYSPEFCIDFAEGLLDLAKLINGTNPNDE